MADLWFFEQRSIFGRWRPVSVSVAPDARAGKDGFLRLVSVGVGPIVRAVVRVPPCHHHLTLDQLQAVYGADGHLQATARPFAGGDSHVS